MKRSAVKGIVFLMITAVLTGCSGDKKTDTPPDSEQTEQLPVLSPEEIPVTIQEHEIVVGETTIQELLDDGFRLMVSEWNGDDIVQHDLDPEEILKAGTVNSEISFEVTDAAFVRTTIMAKTEDVRTGDAPITRLEIHLSHDVDTLPEDILLDGVPVTEISRAKAGEMFPDFEQGDLSITQKDDVYKCHLLFSPRTLNLYQFALWDTYGDAPEPEIKVPSI